MNNNGFRFISLILLVTLIGFSTVFVEVASAVGSVDAHTPAEQAQANFNTLNTEPPRQENLLSDRKGELRDLKQKEQDIANLKKWRDEHANK